MNSYSVPLWNYRYSPPWPSSLLRKDGGDVNYKMFINNKIKQI